MKDNRVNNDKPITQMDELEFKRTFDELGRSMDLTELEEARTGKTDPRFKSPRVVALILTKENGDEAIVSFGIDYGDDEEFKMHEESLRRIVRNGYLSEDECLSVRSRPFDWGKL